MYQYKTFVVNKMNMPFTITFVKRKFGDSEDFYLSIVKNIEDYLEKIENKFSFFKNDSLVRRHHELVETAHKDFFDIEYQEVYVNCLQAQKVTRGYFDPFFNGKYNPTGLVKGWAIENAFFNYLKPLIDNEIVEAVGINGAGDMQLGVSESSNFFWQVGVEAPHDNKKIIAKYSIKNGAIATSGFSKRGNHIFSKNKGVTVQATVIGEYLTDVDVLATVAVAMPKNEWDDFSCEKKIMAITVDKNNKIITYEGGMFSEIKRS